MVYLVSAESPVFGGRLFAESEGVEVLDGHLGSDLFGLSWSLSSA